MPGPRDRRWEREQEDNIKRQYMVARAYLTELAEAGGGVRFDSKGDTSDLGSAFDKIAADLRSIYTLSYSSSNRARDGEFREVTVKAGDGRRVRTRKGYYAAK